MYMENNKSCCFFGHREVTHNIKPKLTAIIEKLITEDDVTENGFTDDGSVEEEENGPDSVS